jgi:hypothetical protein
MAAAFRHLRNHTQHDLSQTLYLWKYFTCSATLLLLLGGNMLQRRESLRGWRSDADSVDTDNNLKAERLEHNRHNRRSTVWYHKRHDHRGVVPAEFHLRWRGLGKAKRIARVVVVLAPVGRQRPECEGRHEVNRADSLTRSTLVVQTCVREKSLRASERVCACVWCVRVSSHDSALHEFRHRQGAVHACCEFVKRYTLISHA